MARRRLVPAVFRCALCAFALLGQARAVQPALPPGLQDAPALPGGLDRESDAPPLPGGLQSGATEPALPVGPDAGARRAEQAASWLARLGLTGFWDARIGARLDSDPQQRSLALAETRLQLEASRYFGQVSANLTGDFVYDDIEPTHAVDLRSGRGWFDLREASLQIPIGAHVDAKLGRQTLTWGVGDLVFLNDLFPKDWHSFFAGRDEEYLKAPSDAVRVGLYSRLANVNVIAVPEFAADRAIDGRRISYFDPGVAAIAGRSAVVAAELPGGAEWAVRLYRTFGVFEAALYGYDGYWKSPAGRRASGPAFHPALRVYGASLRGPLGPGIATAEFAVYDSRDDAAGADPRVANGELRLLAGYERELGADFTGAFQYYVEVLRDYGAYRRTLPAGFAPRDEVRHLLTARLTLLAMNQNLTWSVFGYFSPSDADFYLRPQVHWKVDDHLSWEAGANVFSGRRQHTFFAQFEDATNVYAGLRYSF